MFLFALTELVHANPSRSQIPEDGIVPQEKLNQAFAMMDQFRNEIFASLSEHFVTKHDKLKIGTGASVYAMLIALGVANLHAAIVKRATGITLDNFDLVGQHKATSGVLYALMSAPRSQEDAEAASSDFQDMYRALSDEQGNQQMAEIIEIGFNLGVIDRAARENPEQEHLKDQVAESFERISDNIHKIARK